MAVRTTNLATELRLLNANVLRNHLTTAIDFDTCSKRNTCLKVLL